jgi:KDO2-lipid IV(A) lauroyltransferase
MSKQLNYLLSPRYWPLWLGISVMKLIARLPLRQALWLGKTLGRASRHIAHRRRRIAEINLRLCFPEFSEQQRSRLLKAQFEAVGMGLFETALAWWSTDEQLKNRFQIEGLQHLDRAVSSGRGVILLTGHFTTLEIGARFITFHHAFHALYRPHKNPLYQTMMQHARETRSRRPAITQNDVKGVLKALKQGHTVWYAPDQDYGRNSVFVPFFAIAARTITASSRLARAGNALVVPYFPERLADNQGYRVTILPALENFPSDNVIADTRRINQLLEDWVRRVPEQYLWVHRRFKKRPQGEPGFY